MIKKSASRNQRSKGAKFKHVLQILLPLCICFWLLYQIKRSYHRKMDMTEEDSKALANGNDEDVDLKLGRKDLHVKRPEEEGKDEDESSRGDRDDVEVDEDEIQQEIERNEERDHQEGQKEEDDEEAVDNHEEDDGREKEEEEEEEEDNNRMDEVEDERGGDDADLNKTGDEEVETIDPEEDFLDEDKGGREETLNYGVEEDKGEGRREEQVREDDRSEDKDQDEVNANSHEAREVHYREDDASSAVAHNTEAHNGNTDLGSITSGMESNSTVSIPHDLNQESLEATPGNKEEGKSSVLEVVDNQASNVVAIGGMELAGLVSNVSETITSLPQAPSLMTPDSGSSEVSLRQVTGVKMSNASTDEKTVNVSAVTNSSNKTNTTPSTSNEEPYKPLDLSNNQTIAVYDDITSLDKKQELDDASKASSTGNVNNNVIKMQLPDKQDGGESSVQ